MSALQETLASAEKLEGNSIAYKLLDELAYCIPQMHKTNQARLNVWGNCLNPVSLFFWEPVIDASLVGYLHQDLLRLPNYFPTFQAPAKSSMIFSMIISLTTALERHRQMGLLRRLLVSEAGSQYNETYCDSDGIDVPHHLVRLAWNKILLNVMPSNLPLLTPGSLSERTLDGAAWKLEWTLQSGLFPLILKHGGDPNATILGQPTSDDTPIWLDFVLLSFCIPLKSSYEALCLQVLDCIIAAGADLQSLRWNPPFDGSQS